MDDDSDALEAFEAQLFQIDDDECLSENDHQRELEELLYASTHYSSHLDGDNDLNDSCKGGGEDDKPKEHYSGDDKDVKIKEELNVGTPVSARRRSSRTKRYYDTENAKSCQVCYNCKSTGHASKNCPKAASSKVQCFRCEETGHFARDCSKSPRCYICGLDGHVSHFCPIRETLNRSKSDSNEKNVNDTCYNCKSSGHISKNCPKGTAGNVQCFRCEETGHIAKDCPKSQCCYTCGETGHLSRLCPNREISKPSKSDSNENDENVVCFNCKSSGHISKNCPKAAPGKIRCFRCEETGHFAKDCPKSQCCYTCGKAGHLSRFCPNRETSKPSKSDSNENDPNVVCFNCKSGGHISKNCPKAAPGKIKCFRCEETGHFAKDCPKSQCCYTCGKDGHLSRFCPNRETSKPSKSDSNENDPNVVCFNCKSGGHISKNCPKATPGKINCFRCKETGHFAKDCPKIQWCYTCGKVGHFSRLCPNRETAKSSKSDSNENDPNVVCFNSNSSTHLTNNCNKEMVDLTSESEVIVNKKSYLTTTSGTEECNHVKTRSSSFKDVVDVNSDMTGNETMGDVSHCKRTDSGRRKKAGTESDSKVANDDNILSKSTSGTNFVCISGDSGIKQEIDKTNGNTGIIKKLRNKVKSAFKMNSGIVEGTTGKYTEIKENKKLKKKKKTKSIEGDLPIETSIIPWCIEKTGNQNADCNQETPQYAKRKAPVILDKIPVQKDVKMKSKLNAKKKHVLDHETLNNLRNILSDSGDEKERCDSAAIFEGNLSVPDINVDTSNPENECMSFDEANVPATSHSGYSTIDRGNNVLVDATHYNPSEICQEDLQAYGVANTALQSTSTPKTHHNYKKFENREFYIKRRREKKRSAEGYPLIAKKKRKKGVLKNNETTQAMMGKNVTGSVVSYYPNGAKTGNECNFSKTSEGRTSFHAKKERKENGFLFKSVKKKDVILIE